MSIPSSFMTWAASGCTLVARVPALCTTKRSGASARRKPSAICERAELCEQRKRTFFTAQSMTERRRRAPAPSHQNWLRSDDFEYVEERTRGRARAEDLRARVEDEHEDDED